MKCGRKRRVVAHEGGRKRGVLLYVYIYSSDMDIQKVYSDNENNYVFG